MHNYSSREVDTANEASFKVSPPAKQNKQKGKKYVPPVA